MGKIADGLVSGRYSLPVESADGEITGQDGIAPSTFKQLIGKDHPEFSTMRQQVRLLVTLGSLKSQSNPFVTIV